MSPPPGILVAGAGPAGLTLALQAHDHGGDVRIIERRPEAFRPSRALILHARTLEVLRPLGVAEALLARADTAPTVDLKLGRREVRVRLGDLELPDAAFPHPSLVRQMDVEDVLTQALTERGVKVERGAELVQVRDDGASVRAIWRSGAVTDEDCFGFAVGCDGPASTVRAQAASAGRDGPTPQRSSSPTPNSTCPAGWLTWWPGGKACSSPSRSASGLPGGCSRPGRPARAAAVRAAGTAGPGGELQELMDRAGLHAHLSQLAWSVRVRVQHRVAERFRQGRLFLAGDAAHAYSPATGQGMNTAIQDAANLGWKLAFTSGSRPLRCSIPTSVNAVPSHAGSSPSRTWRSG